MKRTSILSLLIATCLCLTATAATKPNIMIILADDLGFSDIGCFGGEIERQPGHVIDLMTTCVDLGGANYPTEFKGNSIKPMEGVSLRPTFEDKLLARKNPIFWEHESNRAIRDGKWKLVAKADEKWEP